MTEAGLIPLIVIEGPTAVGKSELAVSVALEIRGEVVSADSMQVYRHMDIGSAKVKESEMSGVTHHMIDVADPWDPMDVTRYARMARTCIRGIHDRGHIPILCGGTGFYIQAVVRGIDFTETDSDPEYRASLRNYAARYGAEALHDRLAEVDPASAEAIHPNNLKRVIRALEYFRGTGEKISDHNAQERMRKSPYRTVTFFIDDDRADLYERINRRVGLMMDAGLPDEVRKLMDMGLSVSDTAMQGIGYKEICAALEGRCSMEEAVGAIRLNTRHYAKRQETWFKRDADAVRLKRGDYASSGEMLREMLRVIRNTPGILKEAVTDIGSGTGRIDGK